MKIHFNGFLKKAIEGYPNEVCGMLYTKDPYSGKEEWFVYPCKNISESPEDSWFPDIKELAKIKRETDKLGLIKLGNIHTHPYKGDNSIEDMEEMVKPSDLDLLYAKKFRDFIRIIMLVRKDGGIMNVFLHDKFGNKIDVPLEGD